MAQWPFGFLDWYGNSPEAFVGGAKIPSEPYSFVRGIGVRGSGTFITHGSGPGHFAFPVQSGPGFSSVPYQYKMVFHKLSEHFEVLWSGETSVVGNMEHLPSLWGYIKGPGPKDVVTFPQKGTVAWARNQMHPRQTVAKISLVSDRGGEEAIERNTLTRSLETLTLMGEGMGSVKALEVMEGETVLQRIMPVTRYVVSDGQLDIPPGVIDEMAEGVGRQIRLWNEVGVSSLSDQKFNIETGPPVIGSTTADGQIHDRREHIRITGHGFKSRTAGETELTHIRVDDEHEKSVYDAGLQAGGASDGLPIQIPNLEVLSDTEAIVPGDAIGSLADGFNRRLRVARRPAANTGELGAVLSPATNPLMSAVTGKPVVESMVQSDGDSWEDVGTTGLLKRDRVLEINGTGLNTMTTIEVVRQDGTSFTNPVFIQLPNPGAHVEDNGTRIVLSADVLPWPDADTNETASRALKLYNGVANSDLNASLLFAVNKQPQVEGLGVFAVPGYFNREKTAGDDLVINGTGLKSVGQIVFTDANDTSQSRVSVTLPAPGISVMDTQIVVDTSVYQINGDADTHSNSAARLLRLVGAREDVLSPLGQRFHVGHPPMITVVGGLGGDGNYSRDSEVLTLTGQGLGHITGLDLVGLNGNPILGAKSLTSDTGLNLGAGTSLSVSANAPGWANVTYLLDTPVTNGRRVRVVTPFGAATSATGFTVSAQPKLMTTVQAAFAGGGYMSDDRADDADLNGTYDRSDGNLFLNGSDLRGINRLEFYANGESLQGSFDLDPANPPGGVLVNLGGTQIVISSDTVPGTWLNHNDAFVRIINAAGMDTNSSVIQTQD
ncbi:MAG: hypothetical protein CMO66_02070 [Verrucomicrobiales bacterium]|nr:hypothetical protein [Verrucomicrobiales bacterium]